MPSSVRFVVVRDLLEGCGWTLTRISGSHHQFTKPGRRTFSIPVHKGQVKHVYYRQAQKLCEEAE
jgi:predicted RNA binding protein YcfA (HicA-like mRNA interferase family)